jgi:mannan endo-1,4-beta-mannosidase
MYLSFAWRIQTGRIAYALAAATLGIATIASADTVSPVNPAATASAKKVYNWLAHLPNRATKHVVSGITGGYSGETFSSTTPIELYAASGKYSGLLGCGYGRVWEESSDPATSIDYTCDPELIAHSLTGGLVTVHGHFPNPGYPEGARWNVPMTSAQFAGLLNPGTAIGQRWRQMLDKTAEGLAILRDAGVPVLWRPLLEMNGCWFWWSCQNPAVFEAVWIDMYNYFTTTKGLNNLLWIYSPAFNGRSDFTAATFYPGGNYVDISGLDAYTGNPSATTRLDVAYSDILSLGKPFAFSEIGPSGNPPDGSYDYSSWIDALRCKYPEATYFLAWDGEWAPQNNRGASTLMNDTWIVNKDDINLGEVTESLQVLYDFEGSTESWTAANAVGGPWVTKEFRFNRCQGLKVDVDLANPSKYFLANRTTTLDFHGKASLEAQVKHASWGSFGNGLSAALYVQTGATYQWHQGPTTAISASKSTALTLSLATVANLQDVRGIGVKFIAPANASGQTAVYIDTVTVK